MKQAFVIPVYNHGSTLQNVVGSLLDFNLPIIVIDDGNRGQDKMFINLVCQEHPEIILIRNKFNRGKGYSVCKAVKEAHKRGITHLFQIDADGQHDTERCDLFLEKSNENPDALICGCPEFDETIPEKRKSGRQISNNYAAFVTQTEDYIKDALCGYRIYPVEPFYKILKFSYIDSHMGFDAEILVRMIWKGVPVIYLPVNVSYPVGGKSNFRMVRDNIRISFMFARMTVGMWLRYPILLKRKKRAAIESQTAKDKQ
ncbi:MAG: glycosyltransferase family 2 protein [Treponema sp.]|uniref:glycosyltransferase family 2 protein n=1 Tax=Treponema sp. TaxID=166 RepID=UPI001B5AE615|nr:glycosyltransferase family 2 protein [Treponema sp.]MBP5402049.1 glycosyltransferase family 2 protein [Treponema sp.]MBR5933382.1 glycosyltransferase family 2 protein [Treponema sp.]